MNEQQALDELNEITHHWEGDPEMMHLEADRLLCSLLEGEYPELVKQFKALHKYYG